MHPYLAEEGRIARSARLIGVAWRVIRRDRAMLVLAAVSAAANIVGVLLLFKLSGWHAGERPPHGERIALASLIAAYPFTFLAVFLNVAIAASASEALQGRRLPLLDALGVAGSRLGQIALWSALATGVGLILQEIASRLPAGGRLASWLLGAAWTLVTLFAIPILALEGCGALRCVKRSGGLMRERWGEGLTGSVAVNGATGIVAGVFGGMFGFGFSMSTHSSGIGFTLALIGLVGLMVTAAFGNAVRQVFAVALYRYALDGEASGGFGESDLQYPTVPKKKRRLFRRRRDA